MNSAGRDHGDRPLRVLVVNENANPETVSIGLVGWSHARALSRVASVHQITNALNRDAFLRAGLEEGPDFEVIDTSRVEAPLQRIASALGASRGAGWSTITATRVAAYLWFEREIWKRYRSRLRSGEFDVVHRITPLTPAFPSPLATHCARISVPFVLGPLNGGLPWPRGYDTVRLREREFLGYFRGLLRLVPGYRSTRRHASAILVGSTHMSSQIEPTWRSKVVYLPENGIDASQFAIPSERIPSLPIRVAFVGRLVAVKCVDVLIEAAAPLIQAGTVALDVIGDGPEAPALRSLASRLGVGDAVEFAGWLDRQALFDRLSRASVFGFPSIRDFGGGAVLEAMALGIPPIVVGYGGPADLVTAETGAVIPIGARASIVEGFRGALGSLAADPASVERLGRRARQRALGLFTWEAKARQTLEVYRWVLGQRKRPDFGMPLRDPPP